MVGADTGEAAERCVDLVKKVFHLCLGLLSPAMIGRWAEEDAFGKQAREVDQLLSPITPDKRGCWDQFAKILLIRGLHC